MEAAAAAAAAEDLKESKYSKGRLQGIEMNYWSEEEQHGVVVEGMSRKFIIFGELKYRLNACQLKPLPLFLLTEQPTSTVTCRPPVSPSYLR